MTPAVLWERYQAELAEALDPTAKHDVAQPTAAETIAAFVSKAKTTDFLIGDKFEAAEERALVALVRAVLKELDARGCPHACLRPCPFHRRLDEVLAELGES